VATSPSIKRSVYPKISLSSEKFEDYQALKIPEKNDLVEHADDRKEDIQSPPVFQPLIPIKQPKEKDEVPRPKSTQYLCPRCDKAIIISVLKRPLPVSCRNCGLEGIVE
jgi:DNA-directed RNA polymerase subunit RPC12/RpoP